MRTLALALALMLLACRSTGADDSDASGPNTDPWQTEWWCGSTVWNRLVPLNGQGQENWRDVDECFRIQREGDSVLYRQSFGDVGQCEIEAVDQQIVDGRCAFETLNASGQVTPDIDEVWYPTDGELYPLEVSDGADPQIYWILRGIFDVHWYEHATDDQTVGPILKGSGTISHDGLPSQTSGLTGDSFAPDCVIDGCRALALTGSVEPTTQTCTDGLASLGANQNVTYIFSREGRLVDTSQEVVTTFSTTETSCSRVAEVNGWSYRFDEDAGTAVVQTQQGGCVYTWAGTMSECGG